MPWWTYGARGMQLWFPSSLAEPLSPTTRETMGFGSVSLTTDFLHRQIALQESQLNDNIFVMTDLGTHDLQIK